MSNYKEEYQKYIKREVEDSVSFHPDGVQHLLNYVKNVTSKWGTIRDLKSINDLYPIRVIGDKEFFNELKNLFSFINWLDDLAFSLKDENRIKDSCGAKYNQFLQAKFKNINEKDIESAIKDIENGIKQKSKKDGVEKYLKKSRLFGISDTYKFKSGLDDLSENFYLFGQDLYSDVYDVDGLNVGKDFVSIFDLDYEFKVAINTYASEVKLNKVPAYDSVIIYKTNQDAEDCLDWYLKNVAKWSNGDIVKFKAWCNEK